MYNANAKKYSIDETYFTKWSANMAYILGYISADGNLAKDKYRLRISSIDIQILKDINTELKSDRPIVKEHNKLGEWFTLTIDNIYIYQSLEKLGITPNKSKTLDISYLPEKYKYDFFRGYFDGDGCVFATSKKDSHIPVLCIDIATASEQIADMLIDITSDISDPRHKFTKQVRKRDGLYLIRGSSIISERLYNIMYYKNCLHLIRKKNKFDEILEHRKKRRIKTSSIHSV